jgi:glycerol-3-phosphate dehydrogenase (NAD(P)+)
MKVNILGAGTWGTALAYVLNENNINVSVWGRNKEKIAKIHSTRKHPNLDNFIIPDNILYTSEFPDLKSDIIVLATSTKFIGEFINKLPANHLPKIIIACKGFYKSDENFLLPSEAFNSFLNVTSNLCILTGPTHAEELIKENATATLAKSKFSAAAKIAVAFSLINSSA